MISISLTLDTPQTGQGPNLAETAEPGVDLARAGGDFAMILGDADAINAAALLAVSATPEPPADLPIPPDHPGPPASQDRSTAPTDAPTLLGKFALTPGFPPLAATPSPDAALPVDTLPRSFADNDLPSDPAPIAATELAVDDKTLSSPPTLLAEWSVFMRQQDTPTPAKKALEDATDTSTIEEVPPAAAKAVRPPGGHPTPVSTTHLALDPPQFAFATAQENVPSAAAVTANSGEFAPTSPQTHAPKTMPADAAPQTDIAGIPLPTDIPAENSAQVILDRVGPTAARPIPGSVAPTFKQALPVSPTECIPVPVPAPVTAAKPELPPLQPKPAESMELPVVPQQHFTRAQAHKHAESADTKVAVHTPDAQPTQPVLVPRGPGPQSRPLQADQFRSGTIAPQAPVPSQPLDSLVTGDVPMLDPQTKPDLARVPLDRPDFAAYSTLASPVSVSSTSSVSATSTSPVSAASASAVVPPAIAVIITQPPVPSTAPIQTTAFATPQPVVSLVMPAAAGQANLAGIEPVLATTRDWRTQAGAIEPPPAQPNLPTVGIQPATVDAPQQPPHSADVAAVLTRANSPNPPALTALIANEPADPSVKPLAEHAISPAAELKVKSDQLPVQPTARVRVEPARIYPLAQPEPQSTPDAAMPDTKVGASPRMPAQMQRHVPESAASLSARPPALALPQPPEPGMTKRNPSYIAPIQTEPAKPITAQAIAKTEISEPNLPWSRSLPTNSTYFEVQRPTLPVLVRTSAPLPPQPTLPVSTIAPVATVRPAGNPAPVQIAKSDFPQPAPQRALGPALAPMPLMPALAQVQVVTSAAEQATRASVILPTQSAPDPISVMPSPTPVRPMDVARSPVASAQTLAPFITPPRRSPAKAESAPQTVSVIQAPTRAPLHQTAKSPRREVEPPIIDASRATPVPPLSPVVLAPSTPILSEPPRRSTPDHPIRATSGSNTRPTAKATPSRWEEAAQPQSAAPTTAQTAPQPVVTGPVDRLSPDIATSQPTQQVALPLMGQVAPIQPGMPTSVGKPPGTGSVHDGKRLPHGLPASLTRAALRANKDEKVELTLDPIELGKVRFDFSTTGDRMHVNLSVERGDTLDLLRRNADQLRAEFRDAGFDSSSLSFSQWTQQGGDNRTAEAAFDDPDMAEFDLAQPEATPNRNKTSTGHGLDLRL